MLPVAEEKSVLGSYTPEEQAFHRLLPQIPLSEKLIESRQCGLRTTKRKIVRMGRIYISSLRFCFSSPFLSELVMLCWDDVMSVRKAAGLVFEYIAVSTGDEEYLFSGFISVGTDQMFKLLKTLWTVRARYAVSDTKETCETHSRTSSSEELTTRSPLLPLQPHQDTWPSTPSCIPNDLNRDLDLSPEESDTHSVLSSAIREEENILLGDNPLSDDVAAASNARTSCNALENDTESRRQSTAPLVDLQMGDQEYNIEKSKWRLGFPTLHQSEILIDEFQCSFVRGVHRLGRLFITMNYILFSSVMISEGLQIHFKDVESILKEQTILILDGIVITLKNGTVLNFTSFLNRDAAFKILTYFFNAEKILRSKVQDPTVKELFSEEEDAMFMTKTSEPDISKFPVVETLDAFDEVVTDYGTALSAYSCFTREVCEPIVLPEGKTLLDVFKVCFDDGANLLELYHTDRKDKDQEWEPWRPGGSGSPPFCGQRAFRCNTNVKAVVAKTCPFVEYHRYAFMNLDGNTPMLLVQLSGQITGVMFADSFRVEALVVFTQTDSVVTMRVYGHIQFLRDVWIKKKILRISLDEEMPQSYRKLGTMLVERLEQQREGLFGDKSIKNTLKDDFNANDQSSFNSMCNYIFSVPLSCLKSLSAIFRLNFFIAAFGFWTCLHGIFSAFFLKADDITWDIHENHVVTNFLLALQGDLIQFFRPVVMSGLAVGIIVFYRLLFDIIVTAL